MLACILVFSLFALTSCEKKEPGPPSGMAAKLQLFLADDPGQDYAAVWIDIQKIMVHLSADTIEKSGWQEIPVLHTGRYNLLQFQNGKDTLLASKEVPAGKLTYIKIILGNRNSIELKNGQSYKLTIPSKNQSQINLRVENIRFQPQTHKDIVLDFDMSNAIQHYSGPQGGQYAFSPNVKIFDKSSRASIAGWVLPDSAKSRVLAFSKSLKDTLSTIPDSTNGHFEFNGIPEGNYRLFFIAAPQTGYQNDTLENLHTSAGHTLKIDTVLLHKKNSNVGRLDAGGDSQYYRLIEELPFNLPQSFNRTCLPSGREVTRRLRFNPFVGWSVINS